MITLRCSKKTVLNVHGNHDFIPEVGVVKGSAE